MEARRYMLTASNFGSVLAGKNTKRHRDLVREAVDAFIGVPDFDSDQEDKLRRNPWFRHGTEWEDDAIAEYEFIREVEVQRAGLLVHQEYEFVGCSPDGLVGSDGGVEVKSRKSFKAFTKSVNAGIESVYMPQVQGCMWVSGRKWWDYISYYRPSSGAFFVEVEERNTEIHIYRVYRDEIYIKELERACLSTWDEIQQLLKEKRNGKRC